MSSVFGRLTIVATLLLVIHGGSAFAQDPTPVEGTADFRNPPVLMPGSYSDTIVTGEALWYAVVYTDDTPYRFEVTLPDVDLESNEELSLETRFITPTLGAVESGSTLLEGRASITGGGTQTFIWYIEVRLSTTERLGVSYALILDIEGVESTRFEPCSELPDCTLDQELAELQAELAEVQADLDALGDQDSEAVLAAEIADLQAEIIQLENEISAAELREAEAAEAQTEAEDEIAAICSPDIECDVAPDPGSSTPVWAVVIAALVLAGGLGMVGMKLARR